MSLLPSATEIVFALGLGDDLVGITHECDWPPDLATKRIVSHSSIPVSADPAEIDRMVRAAVGGGEPIYRLDNLAIGELQPDLIVTQDLCAVCAVPSGHVHEALELIGCDADVVSLDPGSISEVLDTVVTLGEATGTQGRAREIVDRAHARLVAVREAVAGLDRPRTFALEWADPPFNGGHWVPEMIVAAGGEPVLGSLHAPSVRLEWRSVEAEDPEVVVFMPCGYDLAGAVAQGRALTARPELSGARAIFALHANAYFSRPGPRLVDGVEILASALHPGAVPPAPAGTIERLR